MIGAHASTPRLNSSTRIAHSPRSDQPPAALLWGTSVKYHQEARGSQDNARRQPITARDAHGCWTAAMRELRRTPFWRTSEKTLPRTLLNRAAIHPLHYSQNSQTTSE